jgi:mitochondrial fission protein ELM1
VKIAILSDNLDGHYNQSIGIAEILKDSLELSYTIIDVKLKNNFLRGLKYKLI